MLAAFASALKTPDLRKKILFTLAMVAIYRLGATVPSPGVSYGAIQVCIDEAGTGNDLFTVLNLFSGGALLRLSVFALGIMPYITASIIVQLLTVVIPRFEQLKQQGQAGQAKLTQYTRYLTIGLGVLQSTAFLALAINGQMFPGCSTNDQIIPNQSAFALITLVLTMTAGTAAIMWMGEMITDRGIGNGMSILIFTSIAARIPAEGKNILDNQGAVVFTVVLVLALAIIAAVVFVEQGQRRLPVQYAKRMIGRKMYGGTNTYLPLKVNQAGVIPVIFATSLLYLPLLLVQLVNPTTVNADGTTEVSGWAQTLQLYVVNQSSWVHILLYFAHDHLLHVLLRRDHLQPDRASRRAEKVRRFHPRYPARPADGGIPAFRAVPDHPARRALPGHHRDPAQPVPGSHRGGQQPELPVRRYRCAHHGRRRVGYGQTDRDPADAAQL